MCIRDSNGVYNALVDYGTTHSSWAGVQSVIDSFTPTSGRTVTLRSPDGSTIASSDPEHSSVPAGAVATALVDPLASSVALPTESIDPLVVSTLDPDHPARDSVEPSDQEVTEATPAPVAVPVPLRETLLVALLDTSLPDSAFVLDPAERSVRAKMIDDARICANRIGIDVTVDSGSFGGYVLAIADGRVVAQKLEATCGMFGADEPGPEYVRINAALVDDVTKCLSGHQLKGLVTEETKSGLRNVVLRSVGEATDAADSTDAVARQCRADAVRNVLGQSVAPPAQLYLTSAPTPPRSWFANAGGTRILVALLIVLVVTLLAAALGARRLLRPIRSLIRATQRMTTGELHARVLVRGGDEIARLGTAFNTMADSLERNEQQRKTLVSDIAHELRNPLANVRCQLEAAQDDLVRMDGELVGSLLEETLQLQHLIDDLQDLALADAGRLLMHQETCDVVALVAGVVSAHRATAENAGIAITFTGCAPTSLWIDQVRIKQAVGNLVSNAIRYTPRGGSIDVGVRSDAGTVTISVDDTGRGISRDDLPHLFDRFFRADSSRSRSTGGSGLGLAITRHLVEAHGGVIDVRSALGRGTKFSIRLPVQTDAPVSSTV